MPKFRKKNIEIEAEQFSGKPMNGVCYDACFGNDALKDTPHVHTIHENQACTIQHGDWIVPEPDGEHFYPVKSEIFERTYERIL